MNVKYKDVKKFIVKRSKWFRGQGDEQSRLQTTDNKMCCLGFYAKECGLKKKHLLDISTPSEILYDIRTLWKSFLFDRKDIEFANDETWITDSNVANDLMEINDNKFITEKERERRLKDLFKAQGIKLKFID
jgi:hypothetical protein